MGSMTAAEFFGGETALTASAFSTTIDFRFRVWRITATGGGRTIFFPANTLPELPLGIHVLIIVNVGAPTFNVRDTELFLPSIAVATNKVALVSTYLNAGVKRYAPEVGRNWSTY